MITAIDILNGYWYGLCKYMNRFTGNYVVCKLFVATELLVVFVFLIISQLIILQWTNVLYLDRRVMLQIYENIHALSFLR